MASQAGKRYQCSTCGSQIVMTRGGTGDLTCCGAPMEEFKPGAAAAAPAAKPSGDNVLELGKRYKCEECGAEAIVTKVGQGPLGCHGEMQKQEPKKMASSD